MIMTWIRGFIYKMLTSGPPAWIIGKLFSKMAFDRNGWVTLPEHSDFKLVSSIIFNVYEYPERVLIKRYLPSDLPCIELGASLGIISREILAKLDTNNLLFSVEAMPNLIKYAQINMERVSDHRRFLVKQAAIYYRGPEAIFSSGLTNLDGRVSRGSGINDIVVPAITLHGITDEFIKGSFSLVLDIEGAEYQITECDIQSLRNCQCMIAELHGSDADREQFCGSVGNAGLKLVERKHAVYAFIRQNSC